MPCALWRIAEKTYFMSADLGLLTKAGDHDVDKKFWALRLGFDDGPVFARIGNKPHIIPSFRRFSAEREAC